MRIEVEDNGRGIADEDHEHISKLFRRSGHQDKSGEGIGLAHVRPLTRNPARRLPVVILTTTDDEREIQRCYDLGANVYITKPVEYDNFANATRQLDLFFSVMQIL